MPWQEDREQRTESASPRRRSEAREKGQVAKSREIASSVVIISGIILFYFYGLTIFQSLMNTTASFIVKSGSYNLSQEAATLLFKDIAIDIAYLLLPLLIFPAAGLAANIAQVGFLFTAEPLAPKLSAINPLEGIKRLLSFRSLVELVKGILKLVVIGYIAYLFIKGEMDKFALLADMNVTGIVYYLGSTVLKMFVAASSVLIMIAVMDYAFQKWDFEKSLRMTKQEIKEEFKATEGQPLVKSRIRSIQREMAKRRMMKDVPKATVVITNPAHLSVAIRYEHGKMRAPVVAAKGQGLIAEKIREIARKHNVPIIENKPLAQVLWKTVDIGKEIPAALYKAVAEVLAYIYRMKGKRG